MLAAIEERLLAVVTAALTGRDHLAIGLAGTGGDPAPGEGTVRVGSTAVTPSTGYDRRGRQTSPPAPGPRIRTLGVSVEAGIDLARRPTVADADGSLARSRLMDDLALVSWALDADAIHDGTAFDPQGADQGFTMTEARLGGAAIPGADPGGVLRARIVVRIAGDVWPVDAAATGAPITAINVLVAPAPLAIDVEEGSVALGATGHVRLRGVLATWAGQARPAPVRLVTRVVSTLDPGVAGTVATGVAGAVAGTRVVDAVAADTVLEYRAPATLPPGAPFERLEIALADEADGPGPLLAAIVIPLRAGP